MTESTQEQRQQFEAAARSAAAKLQAFHDGLTDDEQMVIDLAIRRFVASGEESDTQGYMKAVYEDGLGYKGRPGTGGESTPQPAGSNMSLGQVLVGSATVLAGMIGAGYGEPYPH